MMPHTHMHFSIPGRSFLTIQAHQASMSQRLYKEICADQLPIVYSPQYDITFGGLERLHPFDSAKWGKIVRLLQGLYFLLQSFNREDCC